MIYYINIISDRIYRTFNRRHATVSTCTDINMYSLSLVETTNDMPFSPPETKYDEPF